MIPASSDIQHLLKIPAQTISQGRKIQVKKSEIKNKSVMKSLREIWRLIIRINKRV